MRAAALTGSNSLPFGTKTAAPQMGALARLLETSSSNRTTVQAYLIDVLLCFVNWPARRTRDPPPLTWQGAMPKALPCPC
jgi:hypothetical protein